MSYPLYKETNYPRSCSLTLPELDAVVNGNYCGIEVHDADTHQILRIVSHDEIVDKWRQDRIVGFVKDRNGEFVPKLKRRGEIVFYVLRW